MPRKSPKIRPVFTVKKKRRLYGHIYELSSGEEIYVAVRYQHHLFRSGEKSISAAAASGKLQWALDDDTLRMLRVRGITTVAIRVKDTRDHYLTSLENFFNPAIVKFHNYVSRGGELQRYLNVRHFLVKYAPMKIK